MKHTEITLGDKKIKKGFADFYFIAEIGLNHFALAELSGVSVLEAAKKMLLEAKIAGADAIKFQLINADRFVTKKNENDYRFFSQHQLKDFEAWELLNYSKENDITLFFTFFDEENILKFGNRVPFLKISSPDITNEKLIKTASSFGKPVLLSTGASTIKEITRAVHWVESEKNKNIVLMHCITEYPTYTKNSHLLVIRYLYDTFPYVIGLSDHSVLAGRTLELGFALGANIFEKHFTISRSMGIDKKHSMMPIDIRYMSGNIDFMKDLFGDFNLRRKEFEPEKDVNKFGRRSIFAKNNIFKNKKIEDNDLICLRPGIYDFKAFEYDKVVGKVAANNILAGEPIKKDDIA